MWRQTTSSIIVPDTNVLINFGTTGSFELLEAVCKRIVIMQDVSEEITKEPTWSRLDPFISGCKFEVYTLKGPREVALRESFRSRLGPGEASVLAYVTERPDTIAAIDDNAARNMCDNCATGRKTGSIGLLAACVMCNLINKKEAVVLCRRMAKEAEAWLPEDRLLELLNSL